MQKIAWEISWTTEHGIVTSYCEESECGRSNHILSSEIMYTGSKNKNLSAMALVLPTAEQRLITWYHAFRAA